MSTEPEWTLPEAPVPMNNLEVGLLLQALIDWLKVIDPATAGLAYLTVCGLWAKLRTAAESLGAEWVYGEPGDYVRGTGRMPPPAREVSPGVWEVPIPSAGAVVMTRAQYDELLASVGRKGS